MSVAENPGNLTGTDQHLWNIGTHDAPVRRRGGDDLRGWGALAILPAFGIDTLAVAVGLGTAGVPRIRLTVVVALFEGGMPLIGALVGQWLGGFASGYAVWGAVALLGFLGLREFLEGCRDIRPPDDASAQDDPVGQSPPAAWGLILVGLGVSTDELGAGLAAGVAHLPLRILAPALALQAFLLTYLGLRAGATLRRIAGRYGAILAGIALLAVAVGIALIR